MVSKNAHAAELSKEAEAALATEIASFYYDPLGWVMFSYPWGEPMLPDGSSNPLKDKDGPEKWQREFLIELGEHIKENADLKAISELLDYFIWRSAVASGHGIGKSALVSWLIQFFMSTRKDTRGVVTASTAKQLEDKTWPELAKWHQLLINKHWFTWTATSYYFAQYPEEQRKNYMFTAATVSETNTEAFAGLHNEGKAVVVIFDEASGVVPKVWEVAEGALTDGEGFFFAFGNPTKPDGEFADCFDLHANLYRTRHVDSREVRFTNKQHIRDMIEKEKHNGGEESDVIKVRVRGMFPSQAFNGFIGVDVVNDAMSRELVTDNGAPLIMAIDVARFGDDESVIGFRQGRDYRTRKPLTFHGLSTVKLANIAMELANRHRPDAIVIESTGPGAGVIDIMRDRGFKVVEVHPGAPAQKSDLYFNRRAELWELMRDWLTEQGCLDNDTILFKQLTTILYTLDRHEQRTKIEAKIDMKKRGLSSPDRADTLALTFAVRVARRDANLTHGANRMNSDAITEYDALTYGMEDAR